MRATTGWTAVLGIDTMVGGLGDDTYVVEYCHRQGHGACGPRHRYYRDLACDLQPCSSHAVENLTYTGTVDFTERAMPLPTLIVAALAMTS